MPVCSHFLCMQPQNMRLTCSFCHNTPLILKYFNTLKLPSFHRLSPSLPIMPSLHLFWLLRSVQFRSVHLCILIKAFRGLSSPEDMMDASLNCSHTVTIILLLHPFSSASHHPLDPCLIGLISCRCCGACSWICLCCVITGASVCLAAGRPHADTRGTTAQQNAKPRLWEPYLQILWTDELRYRGLPASHAWPLVLSPSPPPFPHSSLQWCPSYTPFDGFMMCCKHKVTE